MNHLRSVGHRLSLVTIYFANSARAAVSRLQSKDTNGARVILIDGSQVLLVRHYFAPWVWTLPGGGIEKNETPEVAARREIKEETGLSIHAMDKIGAFLNARKGETHVYYTNHFDGLLRPTVRFEIMECKWFPLHELPEELFSVDRSHVENYLNITAKKA